MQETTFILSSFAALAAAGPDPSTSENVHISNFSLHYKEAPHSGLIDSVSFNVGGDANNVICQAVDVRAADFNPCSDSTYGFSAMVAIKDSEFHLKLSHGNLRGEGNIQTSCQPAGGPSEYTCTQLSQPESVTFVLSK